MNKVIKISLLLLVCSKSYFSFAQPAPQYNLRFDSLAKRWDDGIPLGNGWLGALIWQKGDRLRISLDRVDLWDDRPMPEIHKLKFDWVYNQVKKGEYDTVQKLGDEPYEKYPAPTKIPGAALEFSLPRLGKVVSNELHIDRGWSEIRFDNGMLLNIYVHAVKQVGYFGFEKIPDAFLSNDGLLALLPQLIPPAYNSGQKGVTGNSVEGQGLERLGYPQGTVTFSKESLRYHQPAWNNSFYEVLVMWKRFPGNRLIGQWTISFNRKAELPPLQTTATEPTGWAEHENWWKQYWSKSSVQVPDPLIQKQYYLEMYKFGCVARNNTPPISLQAVWTADNGNLPPWKGDFHHDLNTQLSYWPGYTGNHTDLTAGYTNWLWKVMGENKRWTKSYFGVNGLNVPGVTTISGKAMGGWIQYSNSPTTVAWLAQHFYWQWKYTMDSNFLRKRAYPYFGEAERYFIELMHKYSGNTYKIPLSSSPEYNDNRITAWFPEFTSYDLALVKSFYRYGTAIAAAAYDRKPVEWIDVLQKLPEFSADATGLLIAPGQPLAVSHRHHAQLMAIYPLEELQITEPGDTALIRNSLRHLEKTGTREWCGYSFSWAAALYARANEADAAVQHLKIFATNFCGPNSFHLNGDQKGGQYSNFTYRPFTLEGNFAFAQAVHELLIRSHSGIIEVFPAVPDSWASVSFRDLRAEGAVLVSAERQAGITAKVILKATVDGEVVLKMPFKTWTVSGIDRSKVRPYGGGLFNLYLKKGQTVQFNNAYE